MWNRITAVGNTRRIRVHTLRGRIRGDGFFSSGPKPDIRRGNITPPSHRLSQGYIGYKGKSEGKRKLVRPRRGGELDIVAYLLKARSVEPGKRPLLANGSEPTFVSRQSLGKHVTVATDTHATVEVLVGTMFSTRSVPMSYKEENWGNQVSSIRECGRKRGGREPPFREDLST
jgi:hypothetical protein